MSAPVREYRRFGLRPSPSEGTIASSLFIASAGVVFSAWGTYLLFEAFIGQPLCHGPLGCDVAYWIAAGLVQVGLGTPLLVLAIILWLRPRFHPLVGAAVLGISLVGLGLSATDPTLVPPIGAIPGVLGGLSAVFWARSIAGAPPTSIRSG